MADARCCIKVGEPGDTSVDLASLAPLGCGIMTGAGGKFTFFPRLASPEGVMLNKNNSNAQCS